MYVEEKSEVIGVRSVEVEGEGGGEGGVYGVLMADPSFDVWSLG